MSDRSLNPEVSLLPPLMIALGLVAAFAVGGYWLMRPTVLRNPGLAAYQPPAAAQVLDHGSDAKLAAAELAASALAERENRKLGLASAVVAQPANAADRSAMAAAAPRQPAARVQKRQEAPSAPRVAQRENLMQALFGRFGLF